MTKEEKDLLLKDLSARLPYGVKCQVEGICDPLSLKGIKYSKAIFIALDEYIDYIKPYLFPLSSMIEETLEEFNAIIDKIEECDGSTFKEVIAPIDWLNKNHIDYRGLIEKGLAIDATGLNIY